MAKRKTAMASDDEDDSFETASEDAKDFVNAAQTKSKSRQQHKGKVAKKEEQDELRSDDAPLSKEPETARTTKKTKLTTSHQGEEQDVVILCTDEGVKYIDLGKRKRATVRTFKGSIFIDIREYYEAGGVEKPGKKGISLSLEQWKCLKRSQDAIDSLFTELAK